MRQAALSQVTLSLSLKGVTLAVQVFQIFLLTHLIAEEALASYFATLSLVVIVGTFTNSGFTDYAFRLLNRGVSADKIMARVLQIRLLSLGLGAAVLAGIASLQGGSFQLLFWAFVAANLSQLTNVNRQLLIQNKRIPAVILTEGLQVFAFVAGLGGMWIAGMTSLTLAQAIGVYVVSFIIAFVLSCFVSCSLRLWGRALVRLVRPGLSIKAVWRSLCRAFPVGVRWSLESVFTNMLVLISDQFFGSLATVLFGLYQRIRAVVLSFISVSVSSHMKSFYDARLGFFQLKKFMGFALGVFALFMAGFWVAGFVLSYVQPLIATIPVLGYLDQILPYDIAVSVSFALTYLAVHLSYAALGANLKASRVYAILIALAVLPLVVSIGLYTNAGDVFALGLWGFNLSLSLSALYQGWILLRRP